MATPTPIPPNSPIPESSHADVPDTKYHNRKLKLPLLDLPSPETDTLIYLSPISAPSPPLRCSSQKLLATGSPVFERLFGPTYQFRLRRRKNLSKVGLPTGVKFVVDLSPPEEGDEAVDVVEKLWCPDDVLLWNSQLEGGYMEPDEEEEVPAPEANRPSKPKPKPPSYSPTRHTAAIERVLHILHGLDPQIHTTPMWYTVHKVALHLECATAVQDHVISWLYGNLNFIDRYPGLVLQIADEVKNVDLFRDAFAILVGTQLLGGRIAQAGVFKLALDAIPTEALPWKKHIFFARQSLQDRLDRLFAYVSSAKWLDNALVIPEYTKITSLLASPTTPEGVRCLSVELDIAIRDDISNTLMSLFAFSEDPGHPGWMNPWEKGIYDLIPREHQTYSRMYWKQLRNFAQRPAAETFGGLVMSRLAAWKEAVQKADQDVRNQQAIDVALERKLQVPQALNSLSSPEITARQSTLEVRSSMETKGKVRADSPTSPKPPTRTTRGMRNDTPAQRWKRVSSQLKEVLRALPCASRDGQPDTLPPITANVNFDLGATRLPGLGDINVPTTLPPPSYDTDSTLPCYSEHQLPEETQVLEPSCLLRVKRKSREDSWVDEKENHSSDESTDGDGCEDMVAARVLPRAERIEIINPIAKRRCPLEREDDDDVTEASVATLDPGEVATGEPEMFKISGVYEETMAEETLGDGPWLVRGDNTTECKGKEIEQDPFQMTKEEEQTFERLVAAAHLSRETSGLNPGAAYWHYENVRARATGTDKGKSPTTGSDDPDESDPFADNNADDTHMQLARHETDFSTTASNHLAPTFDSRSHWPHDDELAAGEGTLTQPDYFSKNTVWWPRDNEFVVGEGTLTQPYYFSKNTIWTPRAPTPRAPTRLPVASNLLNMHTLWTQCLAYLHAVGDEALKVPISFEPTQAADGQVLVCLREDEWQFMPLWAGGLDDGSGGVFGELVLPPPGSAPAKEDEDDEGEATEVESLGSFDDCMDVESIGSFVFSEFGDSASVSVVSESEFGDSDTGRGAESDVETRNESEVESLDESTEGESESESDDFEDIGWESA